MAKKQYELNVDVLRDAWERFRKGDHIFDYELDALVRDTTKALDTLRYRSDSGVVVRVLAQDLASLEGYKRARAERPIMCKQVGKFVVKLFVGGYKLKGKSTPQTSRGGKGEVFDTETQKFHRVDYVVRRLSGLECPAGENANAFIFNCESLTDAEQDTIGRELFGSFADIYSPHCPQLGG
jgi:hypothetical protein